MVDNYSDSSTTANRLLNFVFPVKNPSHGRPNSWTWTLTFSVIRAMMKVHFSDA